MTPCDIGLTSLFIGSFLAATLLPGGSELMVAGMVYCRPEAIAEIIGVATVGNSLGSMSSYLIGRFFKTPTSFKYLDFVQRYGAVALILAWLPVLGDLFCVMAGWLKVRWAPAFFWITLGKFGRYALLAWIFSWGII